MDFALIVAAEVGVPKEALDACAHTLGSSTRRLRVGPAWVWHAGVKGRPLLALDKGVPDVAAGALAHWLVVVAIALCLDPAGIDAGVHTLLVDAGLMCLTVAMEDAFGAAVWRCSDVSQEAAAGGNLALPLASCVGPTRRWNTWVHRGRSGDSNWWNNDTVVNVKSYGEQVKINFYSVEKNHFKCFILLK